MRVNMTFPDAQVAQIDRIGERLGLSRVEAIRHLVNSAIGQALVQGSVVDQGDALQFFKQLAGQEYDNQHPEEAKGRRKASREPVRGLVTPGQQDKNDRPPRRKTAS